MKKKISIGKLRGLQQCSTPHGAIAVLALDHRQNLRKSLNPEHPDTVTDQDMVDFKAEIITNLASKASAILLDPLFSAAQSITGGYLPGSTGLVVALEKTGYTGDSRERHTNLLQNWDAIKAKRMGASAIKLLVYYNAEAPISAEIRDLVKMVAEQSNQADMPFFLEPLTYSVQAENGKLTPDERKEVILRTTQDLSCLGPDIMKVEFPLDVSKEKDESAWLEACRELNAVSAVPWILLSAAVDYDTYLRQVKAACSAGSSGVAVGRAVWKEAVGFQGQQRQDFLQNVAAERMQTIYEICDRSAQPWMDAYQPPEIAPDWFHSYPGG